MSDRVLLLIKTATNFSGMSDEEIREPPMVNGVAENYK
jgi:hypothetical protein